MTQIVIDVPRDVLDAVKLPSPEIDKALRQELALALYERGALALGKARLLAGMTRWEFEDLMGQRRIVRHYTAADLAEDIRYADGD
ncbi:MAG: UPF0175 family protein [Chloroflexi bacterium]|nr:UPF0175 family protein [Chloroflexota bacterium]